MRKRKLTEKLKIYEYKNILTEFMSMLEEYKKTHPDKIPHSEVEKIHNISDLNLFIG